MNTAHMYIVQLEIVHHICTRMFVQRVDELKSGEILYGTITKRRETQVLMPKS